MAVVSNIDINGMMERVAGLFFKVARIPFDIWNNIIPQEFKTGLFVFLLVVSIFFFVFTARYIAVNWNELTA